MSRCPDGKLPTKATPISARGLIDAVLLSPLGGPFPQIGTLVNDQEVKVPHFLGEPTTVKANEISAKALIGKRVIVFTKGLQADDYLNH